MSNKAANVVVSGPTKQLTFSWLRWLRYSCGNLFSNLLEFFTFFGENFTSALEILFLLFMQFAFLEFVETQSTNNFPIQMSQSI